MEDDNKPALGGLCCEYLHRNAQEVGDVAVLDCKGRPLQEDDACLKT